MRLVNKKWILLSREDLPGSMRGREPLLALNTRWIAIWTRHVRSRRTRTRSAECRTYATASLPEPLWTGAVANLFGTRPEVGTLGGCDHSSESSVSIALYCNIMHRAGMYIMTWSVCFQT